MSTKENGLPDQREPAHRARATCKTSSITKSYCSTGLTRLDTKVRRIFDTLKNQSLNRFEAESYGDHCLNSTVSKLRGIGVSFHEEWERVPAFNGHEARVKRYRAIKWPRGL